MTIKTAVQYCVLMNGQITLNDLGEPFRTYDFKRVKEQVVYKRNMYLFDETEHRVEVARITVIEGV